MNNINKHFNIRTFDYTENQYKTTYNEYKFCLVPLSITPNKKSSDRYLDAFKKLTKPIWPLDTLIKHNDHSVPDQKIDSDNDDITDYDSTVDFYHSSKIIKKR